MKKVFILLFLTSIAAQSAFAQVIEKGEKNRNVEVPMLSANEIPEEQVAAEFPYQFPQLDTLDFEDSIPDEDLLFYAKKVASRAILLENIIINNRLRVAYSKQKLEEEYAALQDEEEADEEALKEIKSQIKTLKKEEKKLNKARAKAKKIAARAVRVSEREVPTVRDELPRTRDEVIDLAEMAGRSRAWIEQDLAYVKSESEAIRQLKLKSEKELEENEKESDERMADTDKKSKKKKRKEKKDEEVEEEPVYSEGESEAPRNTGFLSTKPTDYVAYDIKEDVLINPPPIPCSLPVNAIDQFSGKIHKQTTDAELFRYTNNFMKQYLNGKPHIQCYASTSQLGEVVAVILTVYVRDNNAENAFSGIRQNHNIVFKFIDGTTKSSPNLKEEEPVKLENGAVTVYKGSFPLGKSVMKKIRSTELDKLRIQWNTGFEDYEIYNIDLLSQQLECLLD